MPELPEVETVVRSLAPKLVGRRIESARFSSRFVTRSNFEETARKIQGALIQSVERLGKHILVHLDRGLLHIHLGMTGKLLWNAPLSSHVRAVLELDKGRLTYDDIRQFGRFEFYEEMPRSVRQLGPDPLTLSSQEFFTRLKRYSGQMKPLLLNQSFVCGLGNIYADEILFHAKIHPQAKAMRISKVRADHLYSAIVSVLQLAIENRGSSISDYVDASGQPGQFQKFHKVYGKAKAPCPDCGSPIRRIVMAQRSTHYCPRCQRK